jgi:hypothetical protein
MLDLATTEASDAAWDALEANAERYSHGYERIEVVETRAVWSARRGRVEEARRHLARAIQMAAVQPYALVARLQRRARSIEPT